MPSSLICYLTDLLRCCFKWVSYFLFSNELLPVVHFHLLFQPLPLSVSQEWKLILSSQFTFENLAPYRILHQHFHQGLRGWGPSFEPKRLMSSLESHGVKVDFDILIGSSLYNLSIKTTCAKYFPICSSRSFPNCWAQRAASFIFQAMVFNWSCMCFSCGGLYLRLARLGKSKNHRGFSFWSFVPYSVDSLSRPCFPMRCSLTCIVLSWSF